MKKNTVFALAATTLLLASCGIKKGDVLKEAVSAVTYETIDESYLDKSIRPQDDFFLFANGTWVKNNPVPDNESRWGSFNELDKANKEKLNAILKDAQENNKEKGSQNQILGDYFTSYTSMDVRNAFGMKPIQAELDMIKAMTSKSEVPSVLGKLHHNGVRAFFSYGVGQDLKNVDINTMNIYQSGLGLPNKEYYSKEDKKEILASYEKHILTIGGIAKMKESDVKAMASSSVKMETALASAMMAPAELRVPENTYNKVSKGQAAAWMGSFNLAAYMTAVGSQDFDSVIVGQPLFVQKFADLIDNTNLNDIKMYLTWSTINHYSGHLDDQFVEANFAFYGGVLSGKKEMKPINDRVIDEITRMNFGEWLGKAFVEKHYSESAQTRVNQMVDNLLLVYGERINNLTWMSSETKKEANIKLNAIGRKLGFPSKWEDYSSLGFASNDYLGNYRKAIQFGNKKNMSELTKPVDKEEWGMPAHMVNAYYHPLLNEIAFPAGIMQPPFFNDRAEDAVNYGSIGMVIGHEFTHGFDDMGSKFAADGSFTNWWTEADRTAFEAKTKILGETYSNYCPIDGQCVNPDLTMGENIADLGGLTMAYYAYTKTNEFKSGIKRNGFTPAQRFFISYAQLWKINYTDAEMKNRLANDPHSPGMYRVNGPLQNCPEFFLAFDVKEGDKMRNSKDKVAKIW